MSSGVRRKNRRRTRRLIADMKKYVEGLRTQTGAERVEGESIQASTGAYLTATGVMMPGRLFVGKESINYKVITYSVERHDHKITFEERFGVAPDEHNYACNFFVNSEDGDGYLYIGGAGMYSGEFTGHHPEMFAEFKQVANKQLNDFFKRKKVVERKVNNLITEDALYL